MNHTTEKSYAVIRGIEGRVTRPKTASAKRSILIFPLFFLIAINGLYAQSLFPGGNFWSLDAGVGMSGILVDGTAYQLVIDPKLWLSPALMVGSKAGVNYSVEEGSPRNILAFEGQAYLRWNFLRLGRSENTFNFFLQGGLGLLAAYRGDTGNPFDDPKMTRGSLLADGALGITVPLGSRWHLEALGRGGYPHIFGFSLTAGCKFPLPQRTVTVRDVQSRTEYVEIIKTLPPEEIIKWITITSVEYVIFGPDIGRYNTGIDRGAMELNEMVLNSIAGQLRGNPNLRVRIEGYANPVTADPNEADELMSLSSLRANAVGEQLKTRGIADEQMVIVAFGGTRTLTGEHDIWDRNRRVELTVIQIEAD